MLCCKKSSYNLNKTSTDKQNVATTNFNKLKSFRKKKSENKDQNNCLTLHFHSYLKPSKSKKR